jgi:hypothetical protein
MINVITLITGIAVLSLVSYDFFFTTLSGTGTSFITRNVSLVVHRVSLYSIKSFGRKLMRHFGMLMNLMVLCVWIFLFWISIFLIYSSDYSSIVSQNGEVATAIERLYFSGFVFSTLGIGDIQPKSSTFRVLTSVFSFLGFSFFTTSITYLISVFSALTYKRSLSQSIRNFGTNPHELLNNLLTCKTSFLFQHLAQFQQMLNNHIVNHQAYPVLNYYNSEGLPNSLNLNIVVLDEALSMYLNKPSESKLKKEIQPLRNSISDFISQIEEKHGKVGSEVPNIDWGKLDLPTGFSFSFPETTNETLKQRRKKLGRLLYNEGFSWEDVYPPMVLKP